MSPVPVVPAKKATPPKPSKKGSGPRPYGSYEDEHGTKPDDPRLQLPISRLVGIAEIAQMAEPPVKRETVDLWRIRDRRGRRDVMPMPQPILPREGDLTHTPLFDKEEILRWMHQTGRVRRPS